MKLYGRRFRYQRLRSTRVWEKENESISSMSKSKRNRKKPVWKVRMSTKMRVRLTKSMVILRRFRDSYVEMMLCFAGKVIQLNNGNVHLVKKITDLPFVESTRYDR